MSCDNVKKRTVTICFDAESTRMVNFGVVSGNPDIELKILSSGCTVFYEPVPKTDKDIEFFRRLLEERDIRFIFDGDSIKPDFYTVPAVSIIAYDSRQGFYAETETGEIIYIVGKMQAYYVAESAEKFVYEYETTGNLNDRLFDKISVYSSRAEAEKYCNIFDFDDDEGLDRFLDEIDNGNI